jgi:hypothetical protein
MLPRVFSVTITLRKSGFESRNIRFVGPSSNMQHGCYERSGECIDLDLLELLYYTSVDC